MDGEVENNGAEEQQEVTGIQEESGDPNSVFKELSRSVGFEVRKNLPQVSRALVKRAIEGSAPHFKILAEMIEELMKDNELVTLCIERSIAEEWGVEPEWNDGCCIHCAKMRRDKTAE